MGNKFPLMVKRNNRYFSTHILKFINAEEALISTKLDIGEK